MIVIKRYFKSQIEKYLKKNNTVSQKCDSATGT